MHASRCKAAATLLQRFPPRRNRNDIQSVLELCDASFADDGERQEFLDELVSSVDMQVKPLVCPNSQGALAQGGEHVYFPTEYNRDGDLHRCVHCNLFVDSYEQKVQQSAGPVPTGYVRHLESIGNSMFAEYTTQYYTREARSNVIVWSNAVDADADDVFPLGIAVIIFHRIGRLDGEAEGEANASSSGSGGGAWASTHVVNVENRRDSGNLEFTMHTTVYLDVSILDAGSASTTRFNGFLSQPSKGFTAPSRGKGPLPDGESLMADIGERIQGVENAVRGRIEEIYFFQAGHVVSRLRTGGSKKASGVESVFESPGEPVVEKKKKKTSAEPPAAEEVDPPSEVQDALPSPDVPKKKKKKKSAWEAYQDEEGNTYYYNNDTGETSWEVPAEISAVAAASTDATTASEAAPVVVEPSASDVPEVLSILASLNLSKDTPENYYSAMRRHCKSNGVKLTPLALASLAEEQVEGPDGDVAATRSALESLVPAFGDRKKIMTWIRSQQGL